MASFLHDARSVFFANVVSAAAGLASQACLAWFLHPAGRGEYAACMLFAMILTLTFAVGQEMANVYFVGSSKLGASEAMSQTLLIGALAGGLACLVGFLLTCTSLSFLAKSPITHFRIALLCIPSMILHIYLCGIFLGLSDIRCYALLTAAPAVLEAVGVASGLLWPLTVSGAIFIHASADAVFGVLALLLLRSRHGCRLVRPQLSTLSRSLGYGFRFYLGKLFSMANVQIGAIVLAFALVDARELGLFSAASVMASRIWLISDTLQIALLPRSASDPEGRSRMVAQVARLCLACTGIAILILFVLSRPLIALILSPDFLPVLFAFQLLLPGVLIRVPGKVLTAYFNGIERPGINSVAIAVSVCANLIFMLFLLPRYGLEGVSISMTVGFALETLFLATAFRRISGQPISRLFRLGREDWDAIRSVCKRTWSELRPGHKLETDHG